MFISQALGNLYIESKNLFSSDAATFVYVNIFVRSFSKIDDVKMVSGSDSSQHISSQVIVAANNEVKLA